MERIPFNIPLVTGTESKYIDDAILRKQLSAGGHYTLACERKLENITDAPRVLLTSSCTHALEMCALLINTQPGDEIIMSSYTFVSSANAFALRGAKIVFVDIDPHTMNIDAEKIEAAITDRTMAIVAMHYGSHVNDMDKIIQLADKHGLYIIEDAAHCINGYHRNQHLGTIGDLGTLSFHSTKNIHCGEGGALLINNEDFIERAEILREKGTNRLAFTKGLVDNYRWIDLGSSYLLNELSAAFLFAQLQEIKTVNHKRIELFNQYREALLPYLGEDSISPVSESSNGHIFFIKVDHRSGLINYLKNKGIHAHSHYVPLHSSPYGTENTRFHDTDEFTSLHSNQILRMPLYIGLNQQAYIIDAVKAYFESDGN